jgi:hypothetical protein
MNKHQPAPAPANRMPLSELAKLLADTAKIDDEPTLFSVTPINRVEELFETMRDAGYTLGEPRRALKSSKPYQTEWHVQITSPIAQSRFTMAFFVPEDCS